MAIPKPHEFMKECGTDTVARVSHIYEALTNYEFGPGDEAARLYIIHKECRAWLKNKDEYKKKKYFAQMCTAVENLRNNAHAKLDASLNKKFTTYEAKKAFRGVVPGASTKELEPGYNLERITYLNSGKKESPYSVTKLPLPDNQKAALTLEKFSELDTQQAVRMYFCNKAVRLQHLVEFSVGPARWLDFKGNTLSSDLLYNQYKQKVGLADSKVLQMWAMDRYGNLFVAWDNDAYDTGDPITSRGQMNHSSFCAGKAIICAGMIFFWKGQLIHIDNLSGHYKPTTQNLCTALDVLLKQCYGGTFPEYLRVVDYAAPGTPVYRATSFVTTKKADWPEPLVKNPGKAGQMKVDHTPIFKSFKTFQF